jgi:hypothetical protein
MLRKMAISDLVVVFGMVGPTDAWVGVPDVTMEKK